MPWQLRADTVRVRGNSLLASFRQEPAVVTSGLWWPSTTAARVGVWDPELSWWMEAETAADVGTIIGLDFHIS